MAISAYAYGDIFSHKPPYGRSLLDPIIYRQLFTQLRRAKTTEYLYTYEKQGKQETGARAMSRSEGKRRKIGAGTASIEPPPLPSLFYIRLPHVPPFDSLGTPVTQLRGRRGGRNIRPNGIHKTGRFLKWNPRQHNAQSRHHHNMAGQVDTCAFARLHPVEMKFKQSEDTERDCAPRDEQTTLPAAQSHHPRAVLAIQGPAASPQSTIAFNTGCFRTSKGVTFCTPHHKVGANKRRKARQILVDF